MKVVEFATRRRVTILMVTVAIVLESGDHANGP